MQIDEMIKKLQKMRECYGNTEVRLSMKGIGNIPINEYNFYTVMEYGKEGIKATTMISNPYWGEISDMMDRLNKVKLNSIKEA